MPSVRFPSNGELSTDKHVAWLSDSLEFTFTSKEIDPMRHEPRATGATLVVLELPGLAGCEDGDHAGSSLGLALLDAFDRYEAH